MKRLALNAAVLVLALFALGLPRSSGKSLVAENSLGELNVLVLMVRFPDVTPSFSIPKMETKYLLKLDRYIRDASYGRAWVRGECRGWYTLSESVKKYRISQHNFGVKKGRVSGLIQDSINLADRDVDLSRYSFVLISLGAKRRDYGMMGFCGYPGMLGWKGTKPFKTRSGQTVPGGAAVFCENAHLGVVFHDVAHILGGVIEGRRVMPCLYDHDLQAQKGSFRGYAKFYQINMGYFDPMSCHFYRLNMGPPGLSSWAKLGLNWLEPQRVVEVGPGQEKTVTLGPLSKRGASNAAIRIPVDENTYYLVENRQPVGADRNLPGSGVLILFCDDRIPECRHGRSPVKAMVAKPEVPELIGAPYNIGPGEIDTFTDPKRGITIKLMERSRSDYRVKVSRIR